MMCWKSETRPINFYIKCKILIDSTLLANVWARQFIGAGYKARPIAFVGNNRLWFKWINTANKNVFRNDLGISTQLWSEITILSFEISFVLPFWFLGYTWFSDTLSQYQHYLVHWVLNKMVLILQTTFLNTFSWKKAFVVRFKFH